VLANSPRLVTMHTSVSTMDQFPRICQSSLDNGPDDEIRTWQHASQREVGINLQQIFVEVKTTWCQTLREQWSSTHTRAIMGEGARRGWAVSVRGGGPSIGAARALPITRAPTPAAQGALSGAPLSAAAAMSSARSAQWVKQH